jgi:hypothetical protein
MPPSDPSSDAEKLGALRADIDEELRALDEGRGVALDIEELIKKKNAERGKRRAPDS